MKCYTCGDIYNEHEGTLELHNKSIGSYNIYLANYYKCAGCGALLFPKETAKKIASKEEEIRNNLIRQLAVCEFIVGTEAAAILGITKQAFHKHRRIKNGFIYYAIIGGKKLYNKKSVQLFKETKDGRFNLSKQIAKEVVKYVFIPASISPNHISYIKNIEESPEYSWTKKNIAVTNPNYSRYIQ
ncbi:hypothetical protein [Desulfobacterium sp. N47]|uniref:Helix-turn-helix domain-containing protein n=1 Tax=uncultured Desulfobacterium sp. TaxID=201089 RepID=E1YIC7_9BACT|nr:unknown protein [uncultured Desulfobacterium sp.]